MFPNFAPSTYQDVRKNLSWFTAGVFFVAMLAAVLWVMPEAHRTALEQVAGSLNAWLSPLTLVVVVAGLSALLVGLLDIHDKVYDSWVIKWRHRYDLDVVLPHLVQPFAARIQPRFWEVAESNRRHFMAKLFYPLVADRGGVVSENSKIRFYERATKYWMTQIGELAIVLLAIVTFLYVPFYEARAIPPWNLLALLAVLSVLFAINRWLRRKALVSLRNATLEEIAEVHEQDQGSLEKSIGELHQHYNLGPMKGSDAPQV